MAISHAQPLILKAGLRQQTVAVLLPVEVGRLAEVGLAADICYRHAVGVLLKNERVLRVQKLLCLHRLALPQPGNLRR